MNMTTKLIYVFFRFLTIMGIHGLAKLIADQAPGAIKEQDIKNYFGISFRLQFLHINNMDDLKWCNLLFVSVL